MLNAEESYNNGNYSECQNYLKDAEANLGKTNSAIQYLKVKSLMGMGSKDQYNKDIWFKADAELKRFFEVTSENNYVPEKYEEMLLAVSNIKKFNEETDAVEEIERLNKLPWNNDIKQKWIVAYNEYSSRFPNGTYMQIAKRAMYIISNPDMALQISFKAGINRTDCKEYIKYGANPNKMYTLYNGKQEYLLDWYDYGYANYSNSDFPKLFEDCYSFLVFMFEHGADPNIYKTSSDNLFQCSSIL